MDFTAEFKFTCKIDSPGLTHENSHKPAFHTVCTLIQSFESQTYYTSGKEGRLPNQPAHIRYMPEILDPIYR